MNEYYIDCTISGDNFYPSTFLERYDDFVITSLNDRGETDVVRRNDDFKYAFGNLVLVPKEKITDNFGAIFQVFLNDLIQLKQKLDSNQIEIVVSLTLAYETQCNFELSLSEIELLKTLGATFTITCDQK